MAIYDVRGNGGSFELLRLLSYILMIALGLLNIAKIVTGFGSNRNQAFMNENKIDNTAFINTIQPRARETNWAERTFVVEEGRTTNDKK
jgi:hypothetical protein